MGPSPPLVCFGLFHFGLLPLLPLSIPIVKHKTSPRNPSSPNIQGAQSTCVMVFYFSEKNKFHLESEEKKQGILPRDR